MMYNIEYISTFHTDILSAVEFMEEYPSKAARIFAKVDKILLNLEKTPEMFPVYHVKEIGESPKIYNNLVKTARKL